MLACLNTFFTYNLVVCIACFHVTFVPQRCLAYAYVTSLLYCHVLSIIIVYQILRIAIHFLYKNHTKCIHALCIMYIAQLNDNSLEPLNTWSLLSRLPRIYICCGREFEEFTLRLYSMVLHEYV